MDFNWKRTLSDEYKSSFVIWKGISLGDICTVVVYFAFMFLFRGFVAIELQTLYYVFNFIIGCFLTIKSSDNPGKRIYESYLLFLRKKLENNIFRSIQIKQISNTLK